MRRASNTAINVTDNKTTSNWYVSIYEYYSTTAMSILIDAIIIGLTIPGDIRDIYRQCVDPLVQTL